MKLGVLTCLNLYSSLSFSRLSIANRGSSKEPQQFWNWEGRCSKCLKITRAPKAIFCGNFGISREGFTACNQSWCPECYEYEGKLQFHRKLPENDEGAKWKKRKESNRFNHARPGDSVLAPFQCDDCCYRNLFLKDVNRNSPGDQLMLDLIRRANLDMFWGRDTSTVENAYRQMCQLKKSAVNLGLCFSRDSMGPWPVDDVVGLETAILMLWKSLDKGAHGRNYCQFDTIRKIRTL